MYSCDMLPSFHILPFKPHGVEGVAEICFRWYRAGVADHSLRINPALPLLERPGGYEWFLGFLNGWGESQKEFLYIRGFSFGTGDHLY